MSVPTRDQLFNPVLQALKRLGGSASIAELDEEVIKNLSLTPEELAEPHSDRQTKVEYRLAWARSYLKAYGVLDNSGRGIWVLTSLGKEADKVDPLSVIRHVHKSKGNKQKQRSNKQQVNREHPGELAALDAAEVAEAVLEQTWKEELQRTLLKLQPAAFERLCQRILRESGFTQVTVTGRSGDGGIDGVGLVRLGGLLSFPILFQCKRYQGTIGPGVIRDFRGAMMGRTDRGLVITTGTFSRDARQEATRDGAPLIDLIDGEQLVEKLKELRLGVDVKMIEEVIILPDWFSAI